MMQLSEYENTDHAKVYSSFRPPVPQLVIDVVLNYLSEQLDKSEWKTAVDVGCGSGQSTNILWQYFQHVYGFDISSAQIAEAKASDHPINVHYGVSTAENLCSMNAFSVQLLTASSAAHWFDLPKFFTEVNRVLASNGVVALFTQLPSQLTNASQLDDQRLTQLIKDIYSDPRIVAYQDPSVRRARGDNYRDIKFPYDYHYVYRDNIIVKRETTAERVIGYLKSMAHYQHFLRSDKTEAEKFGAEIEQKFRDILGVDDLSRAKLSTNGEYFIAMARKP